jgi:hypothetical protein
MTSNKFASGLRESVGAHVEIESTGTWSKGEQR